MVSRQCAYLFFCFGEAFFGIVIAVVCVLGMLWFPQIVSVLGLRPFKPRVLGGFFVFVPHRPFREVPKRAFSRTLFKGGFSVFRLS